MSCGLRYATELESPAMSEYCKQCEAAVEVLQAAVNEALAIQDDKGVMDLGKLCEELERATGWKILE